MGDKDGIEISKFMLGFIEVIGVDEDLLFSCFNEDVGVFQMCNFYIFSVLLVLCGGNQFSYICDWNNFIDRGFEGSFGLIIG